MRCSHRYPFSVPESLYRHLYRVPPAFDSRRRRRKKAPPVSLAPISDRLSIYPPSFASGVGRTQRLERRHLVRQQQARCLVAAVDRRRLFFVVAAAARALVVSALPTRSSSVPPTAPSSSSLSLVVPRVPAPPRIARVCLSLGCCYYASPIPKERLCLLLSPVETTTTTVRRRLLFCPCLDLASMISRHLSGHRRKRKTYFSTRSRQSSVLIRCCFNNVVRVRSDDDIMNKGYHQRDDDSVRTEYCVHVKLERKKRAEKRGIPPLNTNE